MNTNELLSDGYIGTFGNDPDVCPVCGRTHITVAKEFANAIFNSKPIPGYVESELRDAIAAVVVSEETRAKIVSLTRPNALRKFEACARVLELHAANLISIDDTFLIIHTIDR